MTAITLTAPAQGTAAAPAAGKAATDAGAGFANLLALLAAPAADTQAGPGQQDAGTGEEAAVPTDGQQATPTAVQPGLPQLSLPALTAPQAQAAVPAAVPAAPGPAQALPAPGQTAPTTPLQPAPAAAQEQPVVAVLSGQVPVAPLAHEQAPARPSAVKDEQDLDEPAAAPAAPAVPAQVVPVQLPVPATPTTAIPARQDQGAPAASGQDITFTGPGVAAAPAGIPSGVPATALPAAPVSSLAGTVVPAPAVAQSAVAPDAPVAPVSDSAAAFGQVAVAAAPSQPAPVTSAAPAPPVVPVPRGYTAQLARPLFTIAAAGPGQHTMTVEVNPQNLGPVTLQAHSGADGIRIEMFAATSDGRDALRQALPELKKDLAGAGINASLDLSSGGQGSAQGGQDRESFTRRFQTANQTPVGGRPLEVKAQNTPTRQGLYGPETTLDVLA